MGILYGIVVRRPSRQSCPSYSLQAELHLFPSIYALLFTINKPQYQQDLIMIWCSSNSHRHSVLQPAHEELAWTLFACLPMPWTHWDSLKSFMPLSTDLFQILVQLVWSFSLTTDFVEECTFVVFLVRFLFSSHFHNSTIVLQTIIFSTGYKSGVVPIININ